MKILIVGAGISGLALARRFNEQGLDFDIIEKESQFSTTGAGICLPANAVMGFERLGLKAKLLERAHQVHSIEYAKSNGVTLAKASLMEAPLDKAPFVALKRPALYSLLQEGLESKICFSSRVTALENSAEGVNVTVNNKHTATYDLVVAADGIHSSIRQFSFDKAQASELAVTNWRFTAPKLSENQEPVYYVGEDHAFMIYPISDDEVYCYGQVSDPKKYWQALPAQEALEELFRDYCLPVRDILETVRADSYLHSAIIKGELESVTLQKAFTQRVVLVGDALHGCPPSLQQGVGLGLEDIHLLADELSENTIDTALTNYDNRRLPRVKWVVSESNKIIRLAAKGKSFLGRYLRDIIIRRKGPANVAGWRKLITENY